MSCIGGVSRCDVALYVQSPGDTTCGACPTLDETRSIKLPTGTGYYPNGLNWVAEWTKPGEHRASCPGYRHAPGPGPGAAPGRGAARALGGGAALSLCVEPGTYSLKAVARVFSFPGYRSHLSAISRAILWESVPLTVTLRANETYRVVASVPPEELRLDAREGQVFVGKGQKLGAAARRVIQLQCR